MSIWRDMPPEVQQLGEEQGWNEHTLMWIIFGALISHPGWTSDLIEQARATAHEEKQADRMMSIYNLE